MAVTQGVSTRKAYSGLSSDTKPTTARPGSLFYETNTGNWFIFNGSSWVAYYGP